MYAYDFLGVWFVYDYSGVFTPRVRFLVWPDRVEVQ
jgi:hypothetical protein